MRFNSQIFLLRTARKVSHLSSLSDDDLLDALELSYMWMCDDIRNLILAELDARYHTYPQVTRIEIGERFASLAVWLHPSMLSLLSREEDLSEDEARRLGADRATRIRLLREKHRDPGWVVHDRTKT